MTCDRKCGTSCPFFNPIDVKIINFLRVTFSDDSVPEQGDGTCELDVRAKPRKVDAACVFPEYEAKIDPED